MISQIGCQNVFLCVGSQTLQAATCSYSPCLKRWDPQWSWEYKSESWMYVTGLFVKGSFEKKHARCACTIPICIPMTISGLVFAGTGCMMSDLYMVAKTHQICTWWRRLIGCIISCRSFSAKEPLIIGLFCGKWPDAQGQGADAAARHQGSGFSG